MIEGKPRTEVGAAVSSDVDSASSSRTSAARSWQHTDGILRQKPIIRYTVLNIAKPTQNIRAVGESEWCDCLK